MNTTMLLMLLAPVLLLDLALRIIAVIDLFKEGRKTKGNRYIWLVVVLFVSFGSIIYLLVGRDESFSD